ncbi:MAG: chloride channel protein [Myxococcales bacterium]|nr:chloride channel protein [Myxococcales bacterium]
MRRMTLQPDLLPVDHAQRVGRLLALCALVGVVAGFGAAVFEVLVGLLKHLCLDGAAGFRPPAAVGDKHLFAPTDTPLSPWVLASLPILGGLVGGSIVYRWAPDADGPGTEAAIDAYHNRRGLIRGRVPIIKTIASAITLGTGGSAGREGPIALIGAGLGSFLAQRLQLGVRERRMLMVAGLAAGIGAIFRAPLAAALFSAEVLYREMDMEFEVIVPSVISSIVSFSVFTLMFGAAPLFETAGLRFDDPRELFAYSLLALSSAAGAWTFIRIFRRVERTFRELDMPKFLKPALGGVGVGIFALILPETIGSGYGYIQQAFVRDVPCRSS